MKKIIGLITALVLIITLLPLQQAEASSVNKHHTVNVETLDVRENPSPRAKIIGSLKNGTVVFVYNTEPGGWSKIKYNNKAGYIATSGLNQNGSSSSNKPDGGQATVTASPSLNVREKPSPKAKIVGSLKKGTVVFVYNTEPGGWSKIKYNNKAGYVASSYLNVKTNSDAELKTIKEYASKGTTEITKSVKIGDTAGSVKQKFGRPNGYDMYKEIEIWIYKKNPVFSIRFLGEYDFKTYTREVVEGTEIDSIESEFTNKKTYTYAQIKSVFGKTDDKSYSSYDDRHSISYKVGNYHLFFTQSDWSNWNNEIKDSDKFNKITVRAYDY